MIVYDNNASAVAPTVSSNNIPMHPPRFFEVGDGTAIWDDLVGFREPGVISDK